MERNFRLCMFFTQRGKFSNKRHHLLKAERKVFALSEKKEKASQNNIGISEQHKRAVAYFSRARVNFMKIR